MDALERARRSRRRADAGSSGAPPSGELMSPTLAELYFNQGFTDKAIEVYRQLLEREPDNERLRRRLAELQAPRCAPRSPPSARPRASAPAPAAGVPVRRPLARPPAASASRATPRRRRLALERTIARLEGMLAAIKKG